MRVVGGDDGEGLCLICQCTRPLDGLVKRHRIRQRVMGCTIVVAVVNPAACRQVPAVGWGPPTAPSTPTPTWTPVSPTLGTPALTYLPQRGRSRWGSCSGW